MKKLVLMLTAASMAASVSAQTLTESKTSDNWYVGINGGVATKTTHFSWLKNLDPNAGIRIGRYFTPVFGFAVEGNAYFSNKPYNNKALGYKNTFDKSTGTIVRGINAGVLATVNLSNWFGGYTGEPRSFEVIPVFGLGWAHTFTSRDEVVDWDVIGGGVGAEGTKRYVTDALTSKLGIDFQFNLGADKAWAVYVEPSINYALNGNGYEGMQYNINRSCVQLNAGVIYKFKNSNGTHYFTTAKLRDQAEIDGLNSQINGLRSSLNDKDNQLAEKDKQIRDLQNQLDECNKKPKYVKPATATNLQPTVLFRQGKSVIDKAQYAPVELIATYMKNHKDAKVTIKGYASPEGSAELNQKLSQDRAEAVKTALVKKYKIEEGRLTAQGMGATDKLFEQVEFNRVATFNDDTNVKDNE